MYALTAIKSDDQATCDIIWWASDQYLQISCELTVYNKCISAFGFSDLFIYVRLYFATTC